MVFKITDIPNHQLQLLGLRNDDIINLPPRTLNALLSGNRTSLIRFNNIRLPGTNDPLALDAKLSLQCTANNSVSIKIHPVNSSPKNSFGLDEKELQQLFKGEANYIAKEIKDPKGKREVHLVTLDRTTNEFVAIKRASINAPAEINGSELTEEQKEKFRNGEAIRVGQENYRLDPNNESGIRTSDPLKHIGFKHSAYSQNELLIDLALLTSGLGHFVMIEHLANIALHNVSGIMKQPLHDKDVRTAFAKVALEVKEAQRLTQKLSPDEIKSLVEHHLGRAIELNKVSNASEQNISLEETPKPNIADAETPQQLPTDNERDAEEKKDLAEERTPEPKKTIQVKI